MGIRVHQIEVAAMKFPVLAPTLPLHMAAAFTWIDGRELRKILWAVKKLSWRKGEPTYVWLIEGAEAGPILVDTGIPSVEIGDRWYAPSIRWTEPEGRLEKLLPERTGVRIEDVAVVVNTHIHFDHSGRNSLFKGKKVIVQKRDLDVARRQMAGEFGSHPVEVGYHPSALEGTEWDAREGDYEICRGVRAILTPGHTPGSQTILVDTDAGTVGLAGDLFYSSFSMPEKLLGEEGFKRWGLTPYRCHDRLIYKPTPHTLLRIEEKRLWDSEYFGYYATPVFDSIDDLLESYLKADKATDVLLTSHNSVTRDITTVG